MIVSNQIQVLSRRAFITPSYSLPLSLSYSTTSRLRKGRLRKHSGKELRSRKDVSEMQEDNALGEESIHKEIEIILIDMVCNLILDQLVSHH